MKLNAPEFWYIVVGIILSVISGLVQASFAVLVTEIYAVGSVFNFIIYRGKYRLLLAYLKTLTCIFIRSV